MLQSASVPVFPSSETHALGLFRQTDPAPEDVFPVAERDPGFIAALLRAANSAASAPAQPVTTARAAILRIGARTARNTLLGAIMGRAFTNLSRSGVDENDLWLHLALTAAVSEKLGAEAGLAQEDAFCAGMLHDVGRMAMAADAGGEYARVIAAVRKGSEVSEAERTVFGVSHEEWGATICDSWHFAPELVAAVANHHHDAPTTELAGIVYHARSIVAEMGTGDGVVTHSIATTPHEDPSFGPDDPEGTDRLLQDARTFCQTIATTH